MHLGNQESVSDEPLFADKATGKVADKLPERRCNVVLDPDVPLFILQGHSYHVPLHVPGSYMFLMF